MQATIKEQLDTLETKVVSLPPAVLGKSTSKVTESLITLINILRRTTAGLKIATLFDIPDDEPWPVDPVIMLSVVTGVQTAEEAAYDAILTHYNIETEENIVYNLSEDIKLSLFSLEQEASSWKGSVHIERPTGEPVYDDLSVFGYGDGVFDTIVVTGGFWRGQVHLHHTTTERPDGTDVATAEIGYIVLPEGRYLADNDFWQRYFFPTDWLVDYLSSAHLSCRPIEALFRWVPDLADLPIIGGALQGYLDDEGHLPWAVELGLSVVFEPADWYFTARDLKEGRCAEVLAAGLIGLILPLVPSSVGRFGVSINAKSSKFLSPQQATVYFGISPFGPDFAKHNSRQAEGYETLYRNQA